MLIPVIFSAQIHAVCALKCDFPSTAPVFALQLVMPGKTLNATNNESIRVI